MTRRISRRTVLKGIGTAIALPWLEAMLPVVSGAAAGKAGKAPRRMAFVYVPNGILPKPGGSRNTLPAWTPDAEGRDYELPSLLEPLKGLREDLLILTGLTCDKARANGDGPGDHARAMASFLTGMQARKTDGANIRVGISVDQVAAVGIGKHTRFPSLEIGCEGGRQSGNCDSGYSCAYSSNLSWRSESSPMVKETNPRAVFERLFANQSKGEVDASQAKRAQYKKSILDFVTEDAHQLRHQLGTTDQRKLDEYLTAIREIETRIGKSEKENSPGPSASFQVPSGTPREYREHLRIMGDLLALAFQADLTRVATFVFANEGSNRPYRSIDVPDGHHDLSHHGGDKTKLEKIEKINRFHLTQYAHLLEKLKAVPEGDGTLLDNCMVVYGSGNGDGNRHNHHNLPVLLSGKAGGSITTGRHVRYRSETPLTNLWLSMLQLAEVPTEKLGDSTGLLTDLS
jgi:hypothetical protein